MKFDCRLGCVCRTARVVSVPAGEKVNIKVGMCYQRGISLNRSRIGSYAVLTVHRDEKCASHSGQGHSMLLLNEMQSETLTGSTRQKRGSKS